MTSETVFPAAQVQRCIVHLVRHSLNYVGWKQRKEVAADLKMIYRAATREEAELRLSKFAAKWDEQVPDYQQIMAQELGANHAVLRLPGKHPQGHLHHQRYRIGEYVFTEDHRIAARFRPTRRR